LVRGADTEEGSYQDKQMKLTVVMGFGSVVAYDIPVSGTEPFWEKLFGSIAC
jgi:hypothetical protein